MKNKRKKSKLGMLVLIGAFLYFSFIIADQQQMIVAKVEEINQIEDTLEEEKQLNEDLKRRIEIVNTDEYIEEVARKELGMLKPGERTFVDMNK